VLCLRSLRRAGHYPARSAERREGSRRRGPKQSRDRCRPRLSERFESAFISKLSEGAGSFTFGLPMRLVVFHFRHGMRRITGLAIAGTVAALLVGGCSTSSAGQALTGICPASSLVGSGADTAADYGVGVGPGPVYLAGQSSWYAGGQEAILMVDPKYSGPLVVRASQLGGDGKSHITLAADRLDPTARAGLVDKERQHGVTVVSATQTTDGGLELQAAPSSPLWRAWFGRLSTSSAGCFAIQADGTGFTEVIVVAVHEGPAPPG